MFYMGGNAVKIKFLALLCCCLLLAGCAATEPVAAEAEPEFTVEAAAIALEAEIMEPPPAPAVPVVLECEAPGTLEYRTGEAVVDYSNTADGYVMVQYLKDSNVKMKVRVIGPKTTYTYNLPKGDWSVYPLSDGNGTYKVTVYRNTGGNSYATVMSTGFSVTLRDEFAPFLRPNQYVNYADSPATMAKGEELCTGLTEPLEKVAAVYDYVVDNFKYDYQKAKTVQGGYLPVLDEVLAAQKGICFDYAAVMTAMLRSQEIPCKLVVGYAGSDYHAWISVYTEENGWIDGAIFFDGRTWKRMDPTFASSSERSEKIMKFIETGSYKTKYLY